MKWLADENTSRAVVDAIRALGHDVSFVADVSPGIPDEEVLALAVSESRILLTEDKGFGQLIFRRGLPHHGVFFVRIDGFTTKEKSEYITDVIVAHELSLEGAFTVLMDDRIRIRSTA